MVVVDVVVVVVDVVEVVDVVVVDVGVVGGKVVAARPTVIVMRVPGSV